MKQPKLEKIDLPHGTSIRFIYNDGSQDCQFSLWHCHPEFEIVYIPKGNGRRFIANQITNFKDGDLIVLGPNIPHTPFGVDFHDENYEEYVIQFDLERIRSLSKLFSEFEHLDRLFEESKLGFVIETTEKHKFGAQIANMLEQNHQHRLLNLLNILDQLARSFHKKSLQAQPIFPVSSHNAIRIQEVYAYINQNFSEEISTRQIADQLAMTESSFCRFFRKHTGKRFKQALTEVRIYRACSMLVESELSITNIAANCGYSSVSLFNRFFKKMIKMTPKDYRNRVRVEFLGK